MTTFSQSLTVAADAGYELVGLLNWLDSGSAGGAAAVGDSTGFVTNGGFRFSSITIPQGATINSATITFNQKRNNIADSVVATWYAWATDNAGQFDDTTNYPSVVGKTTADEPWITDTNTSYHSVVHDVVSIVQEIINRGGWSSGNAINFTAISTTSVSSALDDIDISGTAPVIDIDYTTGGGSVNSGFLMFM